MKTSAVGTFFCLILAGLAVASPQKIAFQRGNGVWIVNADGGAPNKIATGSGPSFSPGGSQIAFTTGGSESDTPSRIAVADLASGKVRVLTTIQSEKPSSPVWSPDGKWILFSSHREFYRDLNVIKPDGTEFRVLVKGKEVGHPDYYSPCWARDSDSIFCHNNRTIYRLGLDGAVLEQWDAAKIAPDGLTGDSRIDVSPDGNRLLVSDEYQKDSHAQPAGLSLFDLTTQQSTRLLTPKALLVGEGCWLDNHNIVFQSGSFDEPKAAIYRMSIDGKNVKRIIDKAVRPVVSSR